MDLNDIVVQQFDGIASFYDDRSASRQKYLDRIDDRIIEFLQNETDLEALDVGTGTGTRAAKLKSALSVRKFCACDVSPQMVEIAKTKGLDDVRVAGMPHLPYEQSNFNVLTCLFNAFGYVYPESARKETLRNFYNLLRPRGYLFIDVLNRWNLGEGVSFKKSRSKVLKELLLSMLSPKLEYGDVMFDLVDEQGVLRPAYFHSFTKKEMRNLLEEAGFQIELESIVGYDSGETRGHHTEGQLFYVCSKI